MKLTTRTVNIRFQRGDRVYLFRFDPDNGGRFFLRHYKARKSSEVQLKVQDLEALTGQLDLFQAPPT